MIISGIISGVPAHLGPLKKHERPFSPPHIVGTRALAANRVKARRRFHKEFFRWFAQNHDRFAVGLQLVMRVDEFAEFKFVGFHPGLSLMVDRKNELSVTFEHHGYFWDVIKEFWAYPRRVPGGYLDVSLLDEFRTVMPSKRHIFKVGIFESLLSWVNETLVNIAGIEVHGEPHAGTWAKLVTPDIVDYRRAHGDDCGDIINARTS